MVILRYLLSYLSEILRAIHCVSSLSSFCSKDSRDLVDFARFKFIIIYSLDGTARKSCTVNYKTSRLFYKTCVLCSS